MTETNGNETANDRAMERAITRALEARREVIVPLDFAARVRAGLSSKPTVRRRVSVSRTVAMVMAGLAVIGMFGLAPHTSMGLPMGFTNVAFDVECVLLLQLAGIACWLGLKVRE